MVFHIAERNKDTGIFELWNKDGAVDGSITVETHRESIQNGGFRMIYNFHFSDGAVHPVHTEVLGLGYWLRRLKPVHIKRVR